MRRPTPSALPARAGEADLDACTAIWRAGIEDYQARLNQPAMPDDLSPAAAAPRPPPGHGPRPVLGGDEGRRAGRWGRRDAPIGFASASVREGLWFLAMLFVDPAAQADGIGQALMDRAQAGRDVDPGGPAIPGPTRRSTRASTRGACARTPPSRSRTPSTPGAAWCRGSRSGGSSARSGAGPPCRRCRRALSAVPFEAIDQGEPDGPRRLAGILDDFDRELIGAAHPVDHAFQRREGRVGFLVREPSGRTLGYVYSSPIGRMGPLAASTRRSTRR